MFARPVPSIDAREAERRLGAGAEGSRPVLVDVREIDEFIAVRADGAVLVPLSQFMARYESLPTDRPLLMICAVGGRSAQATAFLLNAGWTDVTNVTGGTVGWQAAGLPTRSGPPSPEELEPDF